MLPEKIREIEATVPQDKMYDAVQDLTVAEIEEISISDISTLENNALKDLVNHAVSSRLAGHLGGTYTSPPKGSLAEFAQASGS
jgi:hypothetical protein